MGAILSTPSSSPDPIPTKSSIPMSTSSETHTTQESKSPEQPNSTQNSIPLSPSSEIPKTQESKSPEQPDSQEPGNPVQETQQDPESRQDQGGEEEKEEEGECGFCLFMKAGGCKDAFIEWEKCVFEAEENKEDIVDKCYKVTTSLKECMEAHPDHYGPILMAEKAAEKEAMDEMEKSKAEEKADVGVEKGQEGEGAKESADSSDRIDAK